MRYRDVAPILDDRDRVLALVHWNDLPAECPREVRRILMQGWSADANPWRFYARMGTCAVTLTLYLAGGIHPGWLMGLHALGEAAAHWRRSARWQDQDWMQSKLVDPVVRLGYCPACGHGLAGEPRGAEGLRKCPECAAEWRA